MKKLLILSCFMLSVLASLGLHAEEERVVDKAGRTVKKGAQVAAHGVEKGADAAEHGIKKGAEATGRFFKKAGDWIGGKLGGASGASQSKEKER